ncbi:MAG: transcription termination factor NusA [Candidatus Babeliales bacterium]
MSLYEVIDALVEERGLDKRILSEIVCEGMLTAYQKKYPELILRATYDQKSDAPLLEVQKEVVTSVEDEDCQISLRRAKGISSKAELGDAVWLPFEGGIGRIDILRAKQFIANRIREIEAAAICAEFKDKEGTILQGIIHKCERSGIVVKIQDYLAFLPKSLSIPGEKALVGFSIRALLKEVLDVPRNENQLILDRASEEFLSRLFELEVPEVFERLVEIKKIVRIAGYKSKVAVVSHDANIDPVGTCVGVGGARIKPILKEFGTEKIDIIAWTDSIETFIRDALKPAEINRVEMSDDNKSARVWLDDDQRSLAIGKMGQNIALASRLTGVNISLVQVEAKEDLDQRLSEEF